MHVNTSYNSILNWNIALGLKEISEYLEKTELNQLSSINTNLRRKLKYKLFHDINFIDCPPNPDSYLDNSIQGQDAINEKAQEFIKEISSISPYVKEFTCGESTNVYLIYPIISTYTQLKGVCFHYFFISVPTLKIILENLNSLELLELSLISAVEWNGESIIDTVVLPKTLKKLEILNCYMFESTLKKDPMVYNLNLYHHSEELLKLFLFKDSLLPNLESFSLSGSHDSDADKINKFIIKAQNLKSLSTVALFLNQDTINILTSLCHFEDLNLFDSGEFVNPEDYITWPFNFPLFKKLKTLSINCLAAYKIYKNYIMSFPNLTMLKLYYNPEAIEYFLKRLNIKKLVISCKYQENFNVIIHSNSLEYIEIVTFCPQIINFSLFSRCSNLKTLKIIPINTNIGNVKLKEVQEYYTNINCWRSKLSNNSIICCKI
ncbi:hypothetical protein CONCODRAFT_71135 [Conidiobolus coronatus NRRL 28638]|uniref:RNI-like protein n=1 Tax=Conidiobolus coronatus (strain ATCC 28846 / CBS 209.66 / NRRL 28638) TaxID=796925 RepID=A0A137P4A7_CONC2|nr:hypothetical protein CONCODRAFT_71135 [Conidiobolus coronatus NRRL 28638]|eukprot:KXN69836.1 hypothetical protein CONCODRAFT_71135 [Conidiobolus coronatus NRRL 28638]